jgi:uncharacterized membrane-anchored protein YjiN (DUF445 family)
MRQSLLDMVDDTENGVRPQVSEQLVRLGGSLQQDPALAAQVNGWVSDGVAHVVTTYRDDVTAVISETVRAWDAEETSQRIELHVGRDLQFIRINGFVVGALVGVVIHGLTTALL